ncbi:MAG: D-2-hydroxyacid dehydrogenase [Vicinamibacterales bacterium]
MTVLISIRQPVVAWAIPASHVERLRRRFPDITFHHALDDRADAEGIVDAEAAFTWTMTSGLVARARRLRWVHSSAVAVGTLPLGELASRGVVVTNSRGVQSAAIAEHVIACVFALAKRLPLIIRRQETRTWAQNEMVGGAAPWLVQGQTMGIIGLGTIGRAVAGRAAALGLRVVAVRRRPGEARPAGVDDVVGPGRTGEVIASSDVLVLAAPWTASTDRLLDATAIARMKRGAVVINVARGQLVDEAALASALAGGRLAGAALDVFNEEPLPPASPLWSLPNVIITPHTSGFRADHWDAVVELFETQIDRFRRGLPLRNQVDCAAGY